MDCEGFFPASGVVKYGKKHKCRPCHASYRYVRDNTNNCENLNNDQRRRAVVANRFENQRGRARKLQASHQVFGALGLPFKLHLFGVCCGCGYKAAVIIYICVCFKNSKVGVPLQGCSVLGYDLQHFPLSQIHLWLAANLCPHQVEHNRYEDEKMAIPYVTEGRQVD